MKSVIALSVLAHLAAAKTDIDGCTSFTSTVTVRPEPGYGNTYEKVIWYVSDTLEICEGVDCGGGRAPPRNVPGCPMYSGTETVTAKFLDADPAAAIATTESPGSTTLTAFTQATDGPDQGEDEDIGDGKARETLGLSTPTESANADAPLDPTRSASLGGGDDGETSKAQASITTSTLISSVSQAPSITAAPVPGNATTTGFGDDGTMTILPIDRPGAAAQTSAAALAINLIAGVAAIMAML